MKKTDFQLNKRIEGIQKISIKYHGKSLRRFFCSGRTHFDVS